MRANVHVAQLGYLLKLCRYSLLKRGRHLVKETKAHVVIRLFLRLLLLLFLGLLSRSVTTSGSAGSRSSSHSGAGGTHVREQVLHVLALEGLGEQLGPDRLHGHASGGGELNKLVALFVLDLWHRRRRVTASPSHTYRDLKTLVSEDQSSVSRSEITAYVSVASYAAYIRRSHGDE